MTTTKLGFIEINRNNFSLFITALNPKYVHTRTDGNLFSISRFRAKIKHGIFVRKLLFAEDAALMFRSAYHFLYFMDSFSRERKEFSLTINTEKKIVVQQMDNTTDKL